MSNIREASHAGTWYSSSAEELTAQLSGWLAGADRPVQGTPLVLIVPHAAYKYSAATAAYAYRQFESIEGEISRVYLLGPSHHQFLSPSIQGSPFDGLSTPLGDLSVDQKAMDDLGIPRTKASYDIKEHALELQLPFIFHVLDPPLKQRMAPVVPILISNPTEKEMEALTSRLAKLIEQDLGETKTPVVIISSDFCHWGRSFGYSPCLLDRFSSPLLFKRIEGLDKLGQDSIEQGFESFQSYLDETENTICGRNAILVGLKLLEKLGLVGTWHWLHYSQSASLTHFYSTASQVSYVAGAYYI